MNMPFVFRVSDDFRTYSCVVWSLKCPAFYILHHINNKIYASVSDCQRINIEFPFHQGSRDVQCENRTVITITNIIVTGRNKTNPCILNTKDEDSIKSDCDGEESCLIRANWTSDCLWDYGYYTFTYTCRGKVIYNVMICLQPSNLVIFIHTFPSASVVRHHMFDIVDFCLNVKWAVFHQYSWHVRFLTDVWLPQRKEKGGGGWFKCGQGLNILLCNDHSKCCSFWVVVSRR